MFGLLPTTPNDQGQSADRKKGQRGRLRHNDARGERSQILEALGIVQEPRTVNGGSTGNTVEKRLPSVP